MGSMLCFGHFCEVHGPTSILCTQSLTPKTASLELPAVSIQNQHKTCASCQLILPSANPSPGSSGSSNNDEVTKPNCLKTRAGNGQILVSSQYPASQVRYTAVRQACLRALSSEHTFGDSTPMMFSDTDIGTAIVLIFQVEDGSSRGHVRKYALICLGESETKMMRHWGVIVPHLEQIANSIKVKVNVQLNKEEAEKKGHERYLRVKDVVSKSLVTMLKDERIFVELHSKFSRLLTMIS